MRKDGDLLLAELMVEGMDIAVGTSAARTEIAGLTADSRRAAPGFLFAALPGRKADGARFVADAIGRGAVAVLGGPQLALPATDAGGKPVILLRDADPRRCFALMAANFYGLQPDTVVAVTGTNGKTSVAYFAAQLWHALGRKSAYMGTLGVGIAGATDPGFADAGGLTTPDPVVLHEMLAKLARAGVGRLALEASSHGLDQRRLDGVRIAAAGFTNLSRDHLDYHAGMAEYFAAKRRLFERLVVDGGAAVLNADAPEFGPLAELARARGLRVLAYGRAGADLRLISAATRPDGHDITLDVMSKRAVVALKLVGGFQAMNALCALGLVAASGEDPMTAAAALSQLAAAPGRMQRVAELSNGALVYVDYAHTPDALAAVLTALRAHCAGRLWVAFGAGGDRDPGKRVLMGNIARRMADRIVVTDDNPRGENPAAIRQAVLAGCPGATEIGDRAGAIFHAVRELAAGDVLVIAGKGHEQGQIVGDKIFPFDDAAVARSAAASREARS